MIPRRCIAMRTVGAVAAAGLGAMAHSAAAQPSFQGLGDLPGGAFRSVAWGVSADGSTVVGESDDRPEPEYPKTAFRWRLDVGVMESLGRLERNFEYGSIAFGANTDGSVVIGHALNLIDFDYPTDAFLWTAASGMVSIGSDRAGLHGNTARAISDDGAAVIGADAIITSRQQPSRWSMTGGWERLGQLPDGLLYGVGHAASPDARAVAGWLGATDVDIPAVAFRWRDGVGYEVIGDLPGGVERAHALGISADGAVVVGRSNSGNNTHWSFYEAFRWTANTGMVGLGRIPGGGALNTTAFAVSRDGSLVLGGHSLFAGADAFVWDTRCGMRRLYDVLIATYPELAKDLVGWRLGAATAISADGLTIVGVGLNPTNQQEAWVLRILEPLACPCPADFNADGVVNSQDFFDFLAAFFAAPGECPQPCPGGKVACAADFNGDCTVNSQDFFDFLTAFFAGCG